MLFGTMGTVFGNSTGRRLEMTRNSCTDGTDTDRNKEQVTWSPGLCVFQFGR
jgi:hypothetical protein